MARLFGFVGNRADLGARVLELEGKPLKVVAKGTTLGLGDRVLSVRRGALAPKAYRRAGRNRCSRVRERSASRRAHRSRTGGDRGQPADGKYTPVSLPAVAVRAYRDDRRVSDPEEPSFRVAARISTAQRSGRYRQRVAVPPVPLVSCTTRATWEAVLSIPAPRKRPCVPRSSLIQRLHAEEGAGDNGMNLLVTDGEHMVAVHNRATMGYRVIKGRMDLERLLGDDTLRSIRIPDMASCRFCLIASDFDDEPRGWTMVPPRSIVTITRTDDPTVDEL